jgi:hypothetical protein
MGFAIVVGPGEQGQESEDESYNPDKRIGPLVDDNCC